MRGKSRVGVGLSFGLAVAMVAAAAGGCDGSGGAAPPAGHVIIIDLDDHGLAGLAMANAPNLKGLIARGTLAYSRVIVPTHSNQSNIALLSGQYPDGNSVPANSWLSRAGDFLPPVSFPGLALGDYARYDRNPLLVRGDSLYAAAARHGLASAYVGQLPPFEAGASQVRLSILGVRFGQLDLTADLARSLLRSVLLYPQRIVDGYAIVGPPDAGESLGHFTMRDAASFVRGTSAGSPMPGVMFIWGFIALDDDPTSGGGASGPGLIRIVEAYDAGLGDLLAALDDKGLTADTNIVFTLDHGKVDVNRQVVLEAQMAALVAAQGPALGITAGDYAILDEDGDAQIYARVAGAGTEAGAARQAEVTHALLSLIQGGGIVGLDTTRTLTADGALGTRRFHDFRASGPNQADIVVFPQDDWTFNQVDATNAQPGPFLEHGGLPYGRHGGFSVDELYVPLILSGPAFKRGVLIPHPVEHPQVPATALAALGGGAVRLTTAALPAISAALLSNPAETIPQPASLDDARRAVLGGGGYLGEPALASAPATAVVIVDVAGLYDDELFSDGALAAAAGPIRDLGARGTRFADFWTRSRDWPVTEHEGLAGGYPVASPWIPAAEDDPAQTVLPGPGLLKMPPAPRFVAHRAGYDLWRTRQPFTDESLLDAARSLGMTTALAGQPDFHDLHIDPASIDVRAEATLATAPDVVRGLLAQHPRLLAVVALGGARATPRRTAKVEAELATIAAAVAGIAAAAADAGALLLVTSRGATPIDDPAADAYGAGSSRHVPLILTGPNVRAGVVTSQPGAPADIPATVLFALGAPTRTDFVDGTWAAGTPAGGIAQPTPKHALGGHALVRAFDLRVTASPTPLP